MRLSLDRRAVDPQQPARGLAHEALQGALGLQAAGAGGALGRVEAVAVGDLLLELRDELLADYPVALGLLGVAADHEPVAHRALVDPDLLDLKLPATV